MDELFSLFDEIDTNSDFLEDDLMSAENDSLFSDDFLGSEEDLESSNIESEALMDNDLSDNVGSDEFMDNDLNNIEPEAFSLPDDLNDVNANQLPSDEDKALLGNLGGSLHPAKTRCIFCHGSGAASDGVFSCPFCGGSGWN